jgi:hypothetical protein
MHQDINRHRYRDRETCYTGEILYKTRQLPRKEFCQPGYTVKNSIFPSPARMSLTKLSLGGNNLYMTSLFPPRESLLSDIPAGDGNIEKAFFTVPKNHVIDASSKDLISHSTQVSPGQLKSCAWFTYLQV